MAFSGGLAGLLDDAVGAHRENGGVVRALVQIENIASIVRDGVLHICRPIPPGVRSGAVEVIVRGIVVRFDEQDAYVVRAVRPVGLINLFKHAARVVIPARTAPRRRKVDDHGIAGIEVAVQVVFLPFDIGDGEIRCNAPVRELTKPNGGCAKGEGGEQVSHGVGKWLRM